MQPLIKDTSIPFIPPGFTLESHEDNGQVDIATLSLHLEPEQKDGYLKGEVLVERLKGKGANSAVLKYFLDHPKLIPEEWKGKYIYFWGTILRDPDGYRYVLCLCWRGDAWGWGCGWPGDGWFARSPSLLLASAVDSKPQSSSDSQPLDIESAIAICKKAGLKVIEEK